MIDILECLSKNIKELCHNRIMTLNKGDGEINPSRSIILNNTLFHILREVFSVWIQAGFLYKISPVIQVWVPNTTLTIFFLEKQKGLSTKANLMCFCLHITLHKWWICWRFSGTEICQIIFFKEALTSILFFLHI